MQNWFIEFIFNIYANKLVTVIPVPFLPVDFQFWRPSIMGLRRLFSYNFLFRSAASKQIESVRICWAIESVSPSVLPASSCHVVRVISHPLFMPFPMPSTPVAASHASPLPAAVCHFHFILGKGLHSSPPSFLLRLFSHSIFVSRIAALWVGRQICTIQSRGRLSDDWNVNHQIG